MASVLRKFSSIYMTTGIGMLGYGIATNDLRFMLGGIVLLFTGANMIMDDLTYALQHNRETGGNHVE